MSTKSTSVIGVASAESSSTDELMSFTSESRISSSTAAIRAAEKTRDTGQTGKDARDAVRKLEVWLPKNPGKVRDFKGPVFRTHLAELQHCHQLETGRLI